MPNYTNQDGSTRTERPHQPPLMVAHIGREVTVIPATGPGYSRDTEPGLQPWDAVLVGVSLDGNPIVQQARPDGDGHYPTQTLRLTDHREVKTAHGPRLQIGSW